ncbi:MAG: SET domain-containing protein-lysine N-methyltransferase [Alphaproteobacteria bacterium]|nr:SET domain-containing protein-lysine N-methyltransferase [Alphaproteobacteria bacterium]
MYTLRSYHNPKIKICKSDVQGLGSFAIEPILKGEIVAIKAGYILTIQEIENRNDPMLNGAVWPISDDLFLGPMEDSQIKDIRVRINHSCDANTGVSGQVAFIAMRDIAAGEEITQDYATIDNNTPYAMECKCGSTNCRGVIRGSDWHLPRLHRQYEGFFALYLQQKIDAVKAESKKTGLPEWLFWALEKGAGYYSFKEIENLSQHIQKYYYIGDDNYVYTTAFGPAGRPLRVETFAKEEIARYR